MSVEVIVSAAGPFSCESPSENCGDATCFVAGAERTGYEQATLSRGSFKGFHW